MGATRSLNRIILGTCEKCPYSREAWYARKVAEGIESDTQNWWKTGLDLLDFPTLIFYETGHSLHTLRQARRRSWRIGQDRPVRVFFLCQEGTM